MLTAAFITLVWADVVGLKSHGEAVTSPQGREPSTSDDANSVLCVREGVAHPWQA